jgi:hypothetical protein
VRAYKGLGAILKQEGKTEEALSREVIVCAV